MTAVKVGVRFDAAAPLGRWCVLVLSLLTLVSPNAAAESIARQWNETLLDAMTCPQSMVQLE